MKTKQQKAEAAAATRAAQPPVQDVDDQGQPIGGQAAEPPVYDATGDVSVSADPPEELSPEELQTQREEKIKSKAFRDDKRNAISARAREKREQDNSEFREQNPDQADLADAIAGNPAADLVARMEAEARGEPDPAEQTQQRQVQQRPAQQPQEAADENNSAQPLALTPKTYTIRVYGKDETLTEEQLIAAAQKYRATGIRLEDVATREAQLEEYAGQLQAYADQLRARSQDGGRSQPTGGAANPQPPATGAAGMDVKAKLREHAAALLRGDDEAAAEIMAEVIAANAQKSQAQPAAEARSSEQGAVPELPTRTTQQPSREDRAAAINDAFAKSYGDLLEDDDAFVDAQALMLSRLENPIYGMKSAEELAQEVGERVRRMHGKAAPVAPQQASGVQQELEARRTLKAQIPITPPAGSARAPSGAVKAPQFPTRSQYVQKLRQRSGSNSSR